jgi:hypothetical protein
VRSLKTDPLDLVCCLLGMLTRAGVNKDASTLARKKDRRRATDSRTGTRDDCCLVLKPRHDARA